MLYRTLLGFLCLFTLANAGQTPLKTDGQVHTFDSWDYVDCGLPSDAIQVKSIKVSPDPPQPGKELSVTVKAEAIKRIDEGAYADVTVKLGLIKLLSKQFDVCEEARNANTTVQCPVEEGTYEVTQKVDLPKEIPKAKFKVQVRGFTVKDEDMLCLDLNVNFMRGLPGLSW
ncbi:vacuole protein [Moniliophthora roreri MCA 2997]|uniref:Phosphatidylglycerol/phosphatidylinositol transfer protein n=2 Tax=Moniliophthora roreri TaxID=221103 RepID=V2X6A8_MONRO|nr:vacuole protein [Moniliophthora roreri MCA 2997]KAI3621887.1 vacuole protein [Moniliophthora roreri]